MGWFGYGIYDGDGTQTCHLDYLKWAKVEKDYEVIQDNYFKVTPKSCKTILPEDKKVILKKNYKNIIKHLKVPKVWDQYSAIDWQMLLALFVDNKIKAPKIIYDLGIKASNYLIDYDSEDFNEPFLRRKALRNFIKKAVKNNNKE